MTIEETGAALLIVDDDDTFRGRIAAAFRARGYAVREACTAEAALAEAAEFDPEYALVDLRISADSGLDLIRPLRERCDGIRVVVLTGYGSIATAVDAVRRGAVHYLTKPTDIESIIQAFTGQPGDSPQSSRALETPSLDQVEWEHINRVLHDCGGNVSHAAKALGIHRRSLQRKLAVGGAAD